MYCTVQNVTTNTENLFELLPYKSNQRGAKATDEENQFEALTTRITKCNWQKLLWEVKYLETKMLFLSNLKSLVSNPGTGEPLSWFLSKQMYFSTYMCIMSVFQFRKCLVQIEEQPQSILNTECSLEEGAGQ